MSNNDQSVFVVESSGFSDKKIRIDKKKEALTIGGQKINKINNDALTFGGEKISSYLTNTFISDIQPELNQEKRQDIGICHKPHIRYKPHKEPNGYGKVLTTSEINNLYKGETMKNLKKINAPIIRYIGAALLTGQILSYKQMSELIKEETGLDFSVTSINSDVCKLTHSKLGFLIKKKGRRPVVWQLDERATAIKEQDFYELSKKSGSLSMEQAIRKYPFLADIIKEEGGPDIAIPTVEKEPVKVMDNIGTYGSDTTDNYVQFSQHQDPIQKLAQTIIDNDGKIDLNININFKISFGS